VLRGYCGYIAARGTLVGVFGMTAGIMARPRKMPLVFCGCSMVTSFRCARGSGETAANGRYGWMFAAAVRLH
jgi:hypothetical protein